MCGDYAGFGIVTKRVPADAFLDSESLRNRSKIFAQDRLPNIASALGGACWQKPNRLAWCRHIVFASPIKHQQGADERARAFAMTQSCMARLRRRLWIALRS
jgi:hypothetical protein